MKHKGYESGLIVFDEEAGIFTGSVNGLRDVVTFSGRSADELRQGFRASIDDYLDFCKERGEAPEKPLTGRFFVRTTPEAHRLLADQAEETGVSMDRLVSAAILRGLVGMKAPGITRVRASQRKAKAPRRSAGPKKR